MFAGTVYSSGIAIVRSGFPSAERHCGGGGIGAGFFARSPCGVPPVAQVMTMSSSRGLMVWPPFTAGPLGSAYQAGIRSPMSCSRIDSAQGSASL